MIIFSPQAAGVRTTSLMINDNATNSPQSVTINGTANASVLIAVSAGGTMSASVSAGQPAQYQLQATPGSGYSGTLSFACSGLPLGANCATSSVALTSGSTTNFPFTITTSGNAAAALTSLPQNLLLVRRVDAVIVQVFLAFLACGLCLRVIRAQQKAAPRIAWKTGLAFAGLALLLAGCGGGSSPNSAPPPPPPQIVTPSGMYTIIVTPSATASGSNKTFALSPLNLTLIVK